MKTWKAIMQLSKLLG